MRALSREEAKGIIEQHKAAGERVDSDVIDLLEKAEAIFEFNMPSQILFMSLIWHDIPDSCILTPDPHGPRTLADVAKLFEKLDKTFSRLASKPLLDKETTKIIGDRNYCPSWFKRCVKIDENFQHCRIGPVLVTTPSSSELKHSPRGSWYILDGCHKTLVYAVKLHFGNTDFQPVQCIWLYPRVERGS